MEIPIEYRIPEKSGYYRYLLLTIVPDRSSRTALRLMYSLHMIIVPVLSIAEILRHTVFAIDYRYT